MRALTLLPSFGLLIPALFFFLAAGQAREMVLGDTKPHSLKTIVNPIRLIEALKKLSS